MTWCHPPSAPRCDLDWKESKRINCASPNKNEAFGLESVAESVCTHVAAVSWFGRWTLCSSPVNHLEGRRHTHTDTHTNTSRMDTECRMSSGERSACLLACTRCLLLPCFLTIVDTYMQLDLSQIYHGRDAEMQRNAGKR